MSDFESLGEIKPPDGGVNELRELIRWVYTNNPFYLISAALVFYGLRVSFDTRGSTFDVGSLMLGLVGYTLLLAGAAWFLIRFGKLWEDARSLLLLVVFMLLAISVSFDDTLAGNSRLGIPLFLGGLLFAVVLSEGLLRGIGLRLPAGFRWPYYAALSLFFLYPIGLSGAMRSPDSALLFWGLFGFSTAAGGVALMLWPAIRRGPAYLGDNGSPWPWPWYPWTLFGMLGFGACLRAYYLCISFHFVGGTATIFQPYFLVPFLWAVSFLLLELGRTAARKGVILLALLLPVGLVWLSMTARPMQAMDLGFLQMFRRTLGCSPLFLAMCAAALFYGLAALRGIPYAWDALAAAIAAFAICGCDTFNPETTTQPHGLPILVAGMLYLAIGAWRRQSAEWLLGGWGVVLAAWVSLSGTAFGLWQGAIPLHLLLVHALVVGAVFHDPLGKLVQAAGAYTIFALSLVATQASPSSLGNPPAMLLLCYPFVAAVAAAAYGLLVKNRWYYAAATGTICAWMAGSGWNSYCRARRTISGLDNLIWGVLFFFLGLFVSLSKMGVFRRLVSRWRNRP